MPWAIRILQNPADSEQFYKFWTNGRLTPGGTNPPPRLEETSADDNREAGKVPIGAATYGGWSDPFVAAVVTDWNDIGGYHLSREGVMIEWGSATPIADTQQPVAQTFPFDGYVDLTFDPSNPETGWAMDLWGRLWQFGGLTNDLTTFDEPVAQRLYMDWPSHKYVIWDTYGRRTSRNGAIGIDLNLVDGQNFGPLELPYNAQIGSGMAIYDGLDAGEGHGWSLAQFGYVHTLNDSEFFINSSRWVREGWWLYYTDISIIDDGTGADPARIRLLNGYGETVEINNATVPTVTVEAPANTTNTTRPTIVWAYGQDQGNAQDEFSIKVFTSAQYGAGGFDPLNDAAFWEYDAEGPMVRNVRSKRIDVDLTNGNYRAYVWVRSTGDLFNVGSVFKQWNQNVTPPATPTMAITPGDTLTPTSILLDAASLATDGRYFLEYHDQDAPDDEWLYVEGGYAAVPDAGTHEVTVTDAQARFGMSRHYRVRQAVEEPWLAGAYSAEQSVVIDSDRWVLSDAEGSTGATTLRVREFSTTRKVIGEDHWPDGRRTAVVIWGEVPVKGKSLTIQLFALDTAEREAIEALYEARHVLLLRDPYGNGTFVAMAGGDIEDKHLDAAPLPEETTPGRDAHEVDIPVVETARPLVGPPSGSLALVGSDA